MDSLTQAVVGAVVGEVILGRKLGWRGAAWGAFFGTLPDLDVVVLPLMDAAAGIRWHRGLFHAIIVMILASLILAKPLARLHHGRSVLPREMGWMVFWAWSTHSLVDCFTTYGTQVLEPFSNYRVAMNLFYIVDPLFTLPMLMGLIFVFRRKSDDFNKRRRIMVMSVGVSCLYLVFGLGMKTWAERVMARDLSATHPGAELVAVAPSAFNTILWRGLIETDRGYYLTYWSPFDEGEQVYEYVAKNRGLAEDYEGDEALEALKWFTRGHWVARKGPDGTLVIVDMRFTEIRDPGHGVMQPIFQWHMRRDKNGRTHAPMLRPLGVDYGAAISLLWHRLLGEREKWDAVESF